MQSSLGCVSAGKIVEGNKEVRVKRAKSGGEGEEYCFELCNALN